MALVVLGVITIVLLLAPSEALAWGPVTHLVHGAGVLASVSTLPAALQEILRAHPETYLYGCVGADIIQAKKFARDILSHCHSWTVGWQVLEATGSDVERAFAYGYLTHLAGDTFSHNYFVPLQLIVSFRTRTLRHAYWEARFDALQPAHDWRRLRAVVSRAYPACDELMERVVERTLFSFNTNKRIFNSMMALHQVEQWRHLMHEVGSLSRYELAVAEVARYNGLCGEAALDMLRNGIRARCADLDPTGRENLARAEHIRKRLKALRRRRQLTPGLLEALVSRIVPELKAQIAAA